MKRCECNELPQQSYAFTDHGCMMSSTSASRMAVTVRREHCDGRSHTAESNGGWGGGSDLNI
jgi:hypothetical protein